MRTRVVHLTNWHPALDVRIFHKECRTLAAAGYDVHLVVPDPPAAERDGVTFHDLPRATGSKWARAVKRLTNLYRVARRLRADVYHFHETELVPLGILLKLQGARVIYDVHEDAPAEALTMAPARPRDARLVSSIYRLYERMAARMLDGFVIAWPGIEGRFPAERRIILRNFPRLDEFGDLGALPDAVEKEDRVIYAGGISKIRGIFEMLGALALLPGNVPVRMDLLGKFQPPELLAEAERHPGWARVDYQGWCPREEVVRRMARARAGLVLFYPDPSHIMAEPNKLYEYMAAGLPVVASDMPHYRRIVEEAGCGLLVDPMDPAAIAEAVRWMLDHPEEAREMGLRGRRLIREMYHWEEEGRRLVDFYRSLGIHPE